MQVREAPVPPGLGFTPFESRVDVIVDLACSAERLGFSSVSVAEAASLAAPVVLAQLALATHRIELASCVLSVWSRSPAVLAMTAAQLDDLSGGRFVLGLGASTAPLVEGLHGVRWHDPLDALRRTLTAVRALLAGERMPEVPAGARALRMALPPEGPVGIGLASITPPGIRVAGALADRWMPFLLPTTALDDGREVLVESAREAGRDDVPTVAASVPVALGPDAAAAGRAAARWLVTYCSRMGPIYPRVLRERGYGAEVDALLAANEDPRTPVLPAAAERLARDLLVYGTYDDAGEACRPWQRHADTVSLCLPFDEPSDELAAAVEALAPTAQEAR